MRIIVLSILLLAAPSAPTLADNYPVSGRWGVTTESTKGAIDCTGKRVIAFNGDQRTDSNGSVPAYRNRSVTADGASTYRIVDVFSNAMISAGHVTYTLQKTDDDHIELDLQPGGMLTLQRCK